MRTSCLLALTGAVAGSAVASDQMEDLFGSEETVTIATGRAHAYRTAPAVATVITAEDIRNGGYRNVVEALQLVPGFHLGWSSSYFPNLAVRGFSGLWSGNVLFLLDGVAQSDLVMGNHIGILGTIPLDVIDRIEVTRGPGSSVFGADAFSAVVNVITRRRIEQGKVTLSRGSERTLDGRLLAGAQTESTEFVLGAEAMRTDGASLTIRADRLTPVASALGVGLSLAPTEVSTARDTFGVLVNATRGRTHGMLRISQWNDKGLGAGLFGVIDPTGTFHRQTLEGQIDHEVKVNDRLSVSFQLDGEQTSMALEQVTLFPTSVVFPTGLRINSSAEQGILRLRSDLRYAASDRHFITAGIGYEHARYTLDGMEVSGVFGLPMSLLASGPEGPAFPGFSPPAFNPVILGYARALGQLLTATASASDASGSRDLLFGYVQDEWLIAPKWSLTWGVRVDDYSDVGTQVSSRAVLVWIPRPEWTAKLLYGEGFRPPTVMETQRGLLPIYQANASLQPERLRTVELALRYQPQPTFALGLNLFRHSTVDQIRQQDRGFYAEPENVGRQVGEGAEVELKWMLARDLFFRGWYAYQYNVDETTGKDAGYSPHHRFFGSLQYRLGRTFFNLQGLYVGDRARVAEDPRPEAPEYGQLDLLVRHDVSRQVSLQLDVRNLLNANLKEASAGTSLPQDLPLPGRTYYASIEVRF
jgi:outer membrane receptor for ferrienterochelin and colicin